MLRERKMNSNGERIQKKLRHWNEKIMSLHKIKWIGKLFKKSMMELHLKKKNKRERGLSVMKVKWFELNVMKGIHKKDERLLKLSRNFTERRGCVWKTFNVVLNAKQWIK